MYILENNMEWLKTLKTLAIKRELTLKHNLLTIELMAQLKEESMHLFLALDRLTLFLNPQWITFFRY